MNKTLLALAAATAICAGCRTQEPIVPQHIEIPQYKPVVDTVENTEKHHALIGTAYTQVQLDTALSQVIMTQQVRESETKEGFKRVQVLMKSYAQDPVRLLYRFTWTNTDGVEVVDPAHDSWEKVTVMGGDDLTLTSIAPAKNCKDYKLRIRVAAGQ